MSKAKEQPDSDNRQQKLPLSWEGADASVDPQGDESSPDAQDVTESDATVEAETDGVSGRGDDTPEQGLSIEDEPEAASLDEADVPSEEPEIEEPPLDEEVPDDSEGLVGEHSDTIQSQAGGVAEVVASDSSAAGDVVALNQAVDPVPERLMRARADAGLTVNEIASRTLIPRTVIEQLEGGQFGRLPAEFYCLSHLEALCREYGINYDQIAAQFHQEYVEARGETRPERFSVTSEETESGARVTYTLASAGSEPGRRKSISVTGIIVTVMILLLAGLAIGAWGVQQWLKRRPEPQEQAAGAVTPQAVDLKEFIVPQQLPLKQLPIPKN